MRLCISPAAFLVNVMASTCSGLSTVASSLRNLCISSSVFPEPAGAWTMKDLEGSRASSRSFKSGILLIASVIIFPTNRFYCSNTVKTNLLF